MGFQYQCNIIKIMNESRKLPEVKNAQQIRAVNRLLEVAEKRNLLEQSWHESEKKEFIKSSSQSIPPSSKSVEKRLNQIKEQPSHHQKMIERERLRNLIRQTSNNNEQEIPPSQEMKADPDPEKSSEQMAMTLRFLKNAKLRPFNSNMTFYSLRKDEKNRYINSSLSFYKKDSKQKRERELHSSFRLVKNQELQNQDKLEQSSNRQSLNQVIYFKPNKSETVRELLNQMKEQRSKHREIVMNASERNRQPRQEAEPEITFFNEHQLRIMNRYKKFVPFQKDDTLLFKKMLDGDNIWLKKYRQNWLKRKNNQDGNKHYFKRLIVNN